MILIAGGSGVIGRSLSKKLQEKGYEVGILSRGNNPAGSASVYKWDIENNEIENEALLNADYIIQLSGANIAEKRWTRKRRAEILSSRVHSTRLLVDRIRENNHSVKAFISSSAIGYYGSVSSEKTFTETDPPADDFLGDICRDWEAEAEKSDVFGIRTVLIRTGVVLSKKGGALSKMALPVRLGIGASLGDGKQYVPWIHIDDLCDIYVKAIEDVKMTGPYNAVSPAHINYKTFNKALAKVLKKPLFLPNIPSVLLKIVLGKRSELLLKGSKVSSDKISAAGFEFQFPDINSALSDLLKKKK